ncbi:MAG: hypothetical protein HUK06_01670 [Bacteroidaceae bacterium]|nr:hypothetical protein [Bacteroidaceae bacterium]MCF0243453.1 hypothetical protein [Bacteroidaceae bacterium]
MAAILSVNPLRSTELNMITKAKCIMTYLCKREVAFQRGKTYKIHDFYWIVSEQGERWHFDDFMNFNDHFILI